MNAGVGTTIIMSLDHELNFEPTQISTWSSLQDLSFKLTSFPVNCTNSPDVWGWGSVTWLINHN